MTEPGGTPSTASSSSALAEAEAAGAEPLGERLEIDPRVVLGDDEHHAAVLVGEEQVLGVGAGELSRKAPDCSTVNIGACSTVVVSMPSSSRRANRVLRSSAMAGYGCDLAFSGGEVDIRAGDPLDR